MRTAIVTCGVVGLVALGWAPPVLAFGVQDPTCLDYTTNYGIAPPECAYASSSVTQVRYVNPCGGMATPMGEPVPALDVEVAYPNLGSPGIFTPVMFLHGGGVANSFKDLHAAGHAVNPYQDLVTSLVFQGLVVVMPIDPNIAASYYPYDMGATRGTAWRTSTVFECLLKRLDVGTTESPGACTRDGSCLWGDPLVNRIAWRSGDRESVVVIGHSFGGVTAMYMPDAFRGQVKGLILIDPARDFPMAMPSMVPTNAPVIHFYPDWYGPFSQAESNPTFSLWSGMTNNPWVPIGIRDYPGGPTCAPGTSCDCNPNTGCHEAHHCSGFSNTMAYAEFQGWNSGHGTWCTSTTKTCTGGGAYNGLLCTTSAECNGGTCDACPAARVVNPHATHPVPLGSPPMGIAAGGITGQFTRCIYGPTKPPAATWRADGYQDSMNASRTLKRYVTAYANCLGGLNGVRTQPWINGKQRFYDDRGYIAGGENASCTRNGLDDASCAINTTASSCQTAGCTWTQVMDGKIIRINNGQWVTEYDGANSGNPRYPFANGVTFDANGDFWEQSQRLGTTGMPAAPYYNIICSSGPGRM